MVFWHCFLIASLKKVRDDDAAGDPKSRLVHFVKSIDKDNREQSLNFRLDTLTSENFVYMLLEYNKEKTFMWYIF